MNPSAKPLHHLLALATIVLLTGCSTIRVKLGTRVSLAKTPVATMEASLYGDPGIAPGGKAGLVVALTQPDGKVLMTEGKAKGKVLWKDLVVTATVVTADKKGNVTLPRDPRLSDGKTAHVTITAPSQPTLRADLDIPISYQYAFVSNFSGANGSSGANGTDGLAGSSGSMGSFDPANPSPGGDGGPGGNGSNGQDGGNGGDAPPVTVRVTLRPGPKPLLQAGVSAPGHKERFYLVDVQGGSLLIEAQGGAGGSGGAGGHGGAGGSGGAGTPSGNSGTNGMDGSSGSNGFPGSAGPITITYDFSVKPFLAILKTANQGGPNPTYTQAPIPPLW